MCRWYYIVVVPVTADPQPRRENPEDIDLDAVRRSLGSFWGSFIYKFLLYYYNKINEKRVFVKHLSSRVVVGT